MRIVHAAIFNTFKYGDDYYSTDRKISNGLIRNGHFVYDFSYRDICRSENIFKTTKLGTGKVNTKLIETVRKVKPDLLLLGHSELITTNALQEIRKISPNIKIAMWYIDPLFHKHHTKHIFDRMEVMDAFFPTTGGELLKEFKTKTNRVSFLPNISDSSTDILRNHEHPNLHIDFLYCGSDYKEPKRTSFLKNLFDGLKTSMRCEIWGSFGQPFLCAHTYIEKLSQAKMGLNYSRRNDVHLYTSNRIIQLAGNGILTFSPKVPGMECIYNDNEIVYFDDIDDLFEKVKFYYKNDDARKEIAENGWKRTHNSYNSTRITKFMLELIFNEDFSENYEWKDEIYL